MYRQGLGDCFLVTFSRPGAKPVRMLIDCGVFYLTPEAKRKLIEVATDIERQLGGEPLDLLVATHEHYDHLSGFVLAKEVFDRIDVKQTWVAWTEDPNNALANTLRKRSEEHTSELQSRG